MRTKKVFTPEPLLAFEFLNSSGKIMPLTFRDPLKIITAQTIEEVHASFQLVQEAVNSGYYAAGFLTYESAPAFDSAFQVKDGITLPMLWFGIFTHPQNLPINSTGTYTLKEWKPSVSREDYQTSIQSIKQSIENGDTYQTNYTIRLKSLFQGDDIAYFEKLKRAQASNYCAYINTSEVSILSASPELFFHLDGNNLTTRPMKGTIKRGNTFTEDKANASWLYHSEKNRAENLMIVDLLRNDLGIIAEPGTVTVPNLFDIEHYPTVHQMTSTITAKVSQDTQIIDIFKALFPCGSITGAPKISTMNIIADRETSPREIYCGAIGYITPQKEAIFNVPIRTIWIDHKSGEATYGVGGGITWDSTTEDEYHEILAKASFLEENRPQFQLLESLLINDGVCFLLEEHLKRLENSAQYFSFKIEMDNVKKTLQEFANLYNNGKVKARLLIGKNNEITIEGQPITDLETPLKVILADEPINKDNPFLYHKTTNREIYSHFQRKKPADVFDILLWNEDQQLTEFTNGNVVLVIDGQYWTPPVQSGLLSGTFRESLLFNGIISEKTLTLADLNKSTKIWFINSVRKWLEVLIIK